MFYCTTIFSGLLHSHGFNIISTWVIQKFTSLAGAFPLKNRLICSGTICCISHTGISKLASLRIKLFIFLFMPHKHKKCAYTHIHTHAHTPACARMCVRDIIPPSFQTRTYLWSWVFFSRLGVFWVTCK